MKISYKEPGFAAGVESEIDLDKIMIDEDGTKASLTKFFTKIVTSIQSHDGRCKRLHDRCVTLETEMMENQTNMNAMSILMEQMTSKISYLSENNQVLCRRLGIEP